MCGPETPSSTPRIGARVDLSSPTGRGILGNLLFLNPTSPSSAHATHVRFIQPATSIPPFDDNLLVSIHMTGDLTKPLADAGLMQQFTLRRTPTSTPTTTPTTTPNNNPLTTSRADAEVQFEETPLSAALSLQVGSDGIIGRRVSMRRGGELLADGIVGFNSLPVVLGGGEL